MKDLLWGFTLLALLPINYAAARAERPAIGRLVLLTTSIPAIALVGFCAFQLAYAIINADEVNRRFQEGDLTYFGADIAFVGSLLLGSLWVGLAYVGFAWGRWTRAGK